LDGTESAGRLLAIVLALNGTMLLPSENSLTLDVISFQVLDVISLADGLDQHVHLIWELGDEDHGLEMRRDGGFGCCHPGKTYEDGVDGESGIGVPGDDDIHRHFEFLIRCGDPRFAIGALEELPS